MFKRKPEDFNCKQCGTFVKGNGFTNHCPQCLWSRHIDIHPGDRANLCKGMMEPIRVELKRGEHVLVHRCLTCKQEKRCRIAQQDNLQIISEVSQSMVLPDSLYIL